MNEQRLHELYTHLMYGDLGHKKFDFNQVSNTKTDECGTLGCAIGECPILWEEWGFGWNGCMSFEGRTVLGFDIARTWFDIDYGESNHLFNPCSQNPKMYGGEHLKGHATRQEVANNIKQFMLKKWEEKED